MTWSESPWIFPPLGWEPFDEVKSIDTPAINTQTVVLAKKIPQGYDGVIRRISNNFTGGGFVQASGQLVWRIALDNQVVRNYGNIQVEMGSISHPRETDGILVRAGQVVRYYVTCTDGALIGGTKIICCFAGYIWPKEIVSDALTR